MIIPSIDIRAGRAVQLRQGREFVLDGGDPLDRLDEFAVAGEVAVIDLDAALGTGSNAELIREMCRRSSIRVGGGIRTVEDALDWLDVGAGHVIVGTAASEDFCRALPRERLIVAVDAFRGEVVVEGWQTRTGDSVVDRIRRLAPYAGGFLLTQVEWEGSLSGFDSDLIRTAVGAAGNVRITAAGGISKVEEIAELDQLGVDSQVGMAIYSGKLSLGEAIASVLTKPVSGQFWPTIVVDENGRTLGLVWSTRESIESAVRERSGIYWSRSRDSLWRKGESSGNTQQLVRIDVDCDRDALRFTVHQKGVFCHTGMRSCFGSDFDVRALENVLLERYQVLDPASGTTRLLTDEHLLRDKLIEEAGELARASSRADVVHEAADLVYFAMVALVRGGASFSDVVSELGRRSLHVRRRPMYSKIRAGGVDDGLSDPDAR